MPYSRCIKKNPEARRGFKPVTRCQMLHIYKPLSEWTIDTILTALRPARLEKNHIKHKLQCLRAPDKCCNASQNTTKVATYATFLICFRPFSRIINSASKLNYNNPGFFRKSSCLIIIKKLASISRGRQDFGPLYKPAVILDRYGLCF